MNVDKDAFVPEKSIEQRFDDWYDWLTDGEKAAFFNGHHFNWDGFFVDAGVGLAAGALFLLALYFVTRYPDRHVRLRDESDRRHVAAGSSALIP